MAAAAARLPMRGWCSWPRDYLRLSSSSTAGAELRSLVSDLRLQGRRRYACRLLLLSRPTRGRRLGSFQPNFSDHDFEMCYRETDTDGNGVISKSEMRMFIRNVAGV